MDWFVNDKDFRHEKVNSRRVDCQPNLTLFI